MAKDATNLQPWKKSSGFGYTTFEDGPYFNMGVGWSLYRQ